MGEKTCEGNELVMILFLFNNVIFWGKNTATVTIVHWYCNILAAPDWKAINWYCNFLLTGFLKWVDYYQCFFSPFATVLCLYLSVYLYFIYFYIIKLNLLVEKTCLYKALLADVCYIHIYVIQYVCWKSTYELSKGDWVSLCKNQSSCSTC